MHSSSSIYQKVQHYYPLWQHEILLVEDVNACFYYLKELPENFRGIRHKIFDLLKVWGSDKLAYKLKNRHVICIRVFMLYVFALYS